MENFDDLARELGERGIIKLEGLVASKDTRAAYDMILDLAAEHGIYTDGRWIKSTSRFGYPKPFRNALNGLNRSEEFPDLVGNRLTPLVEGFVGQPATPLSPGQQILFTLPGEDDWSVPSDAWHIDMPKFGEQASPGLQAFTFLDDVDPQGGATLVIAGSHRLLNNTAGLSSKELKRHLRKEDYFRSLFDPNLPTIANPEETVGRVGNVELKVVELSGRAGDVYLMDLRVLHTPAQNCSDKARLMLTCRFPRSTIAASFGNPSLVN
ncbi:phytanoyl-CoA dioxygenase family protein [Sphingorhabdus sp. Alg231-15]|uniref:phytanoyl-CoA dioxygenase family protein n=1 Tax=Sphingorhabdus sp. Alg231-15 TaxID=1922222 RepID=UPI000D560722